jgi:hypothetical protein
MNRKPLDAPIFPEVESMSNDEVLLLRAIVRNEMRRRGMADSVGAVGEQLAIEHFRKTAGLPKLTSASRGTKNVDANSNRGERYSIKTICDAKKTGTIYPESDDSEKQLFEYILIVKLADDWSLKAIHQLSWSDFVRVRAWDKRMNAWYVPISARTLSTSKLIFAVA